MIAADTSSLIAYFSGRSGKDIETLEWSFENKQITLPPVVLTELLSDPKLPEKIKNLFLGVPVLTVMDGYWERAGLTRAKLISFHVKAKLADTLIAQSCMDYDFPLITRDRDFRHFTQLGLNLLP